MEAGPVVGPAMMSPGMNARLFPSNWRPVVDEIAFAHEQGFHSLQLPGQESGEVNHHLRLGLGALDLTGYLAALLAGGFIHGASRMTIIQDVAARIDDYVDLAMREGRSPGLALALTDREQVLHSSTYGFANLASRFLVNGPGKPHEIAVFALRVLRAAQEQQELPPVPAPAESLRVANAADYAGDYVAGAKHLTLVADEPRLVAQYETEAIPLEPRGTDVFSLNHPNFALFLLRFRREAEQVMAVTHGADWYVRDGHAEPESKDIPPAWTAYVGHYWSHNPWLAHLRVVLRHGTLLLAIGGGEQVLVPLADGCFRVGDDDRSPERLCFDSAVKNQALRAMLSGCPYYRAFTP